MKTPFIFRLIFFGLITGLIVTNSCKKNIPGGEDPDDSESDTTYVVSIAGNSHITVPKSGYTEMIHLARGLINWSSTETTISTYIKVPKNGKLKISLKAKQPEIGVNSKVKVTINGIAKFTQITDTAFQVYDIGKFNITSGYIKIDLNGISKTGQYFAEVSDILVSGSAVNEGIIYCNDRNSYLFSRLGSQNSFVLSNSTVPNDPIRYFYYELNIPTSPDPIHPFYAAAFFEHGSFGIRPISDSKTQYELYISDPSPAMDPGLMPITLLRKGENVIATGMGRSSVKATLEYNWTPSNTYKFLLKAEPTDLDNVDFTGWVFTPEDNKWKLIAAFKRPLTNAKGIEGLTLSLKNENLALGYLGHRANYLNSWSFTSTGNWNKYTEAKYNADLLTIKNQRVDTYGDKINHGVYLRAGGYFNETQKPDTLFNIVNSNTQPLIDFNNLP